MLTATAGKGSQFYHQGADKHKQSKMVGMLKWDSNCDLKPNHLVNQTNNLDC
jgi:hypothetical protein